MSYDQYCFALHIYRSPAKWRKGNVLIRVCQCVCPQGGTHVAIKHDALDLTVQGPSPSLYSAPSHSSPYPASDIWWPRMEACLNLFTS